MVPKHNPKSETCNTPKTPDKTLMRDLCSKPVLEYACPGCGARYTTLQAAYLIDFADGQFHCEACGAVLLAAEDAAAGEGTPRAARARARSGCARPRRCRRALAAAEILHLKP